MQIIFSIPRFMSLIRFSLLFVRISNSYSCFLRLTTVWTLPPVSHSVGVTQKHYMLLIFILHLLHFFLSPLSSWLLRLCFYPYYLFCVSLSSSLSFFCLYCHLLTFVLICRTVLKVSKYSLIMRLVCFHALIPSSCCSLGARCTERDVNSSGRLWRSWLQY